MGETVKGLNKYNILDGEDDMKNYNTVIEILAEIIDKQLREEKDKGGH